MMVQIINDKLGHFEFDIDSIEEDGYKIFKYADMTWNKWSWNQYTVYADGHVLQTVLNPHKLSIMDNDHE